MCVLLILIGYQSCVCVCALDHLGHKFKPLEYEETCAINDLVFNDLRTVF